VPRVFLQGLASMTTNLNQPSIPTNFLSFLIYIGYALTSDNCTHWYETVGIRPSTIYKLTTGFRHRPLFHVTDYAFKCFERYNLTVGASRLLGRPCQPILDPRVDGFTKSPILSHCFGLAHSNFTASCSMIYILHSKFP
jgi:hypothetical protein